MMMKLTTAQIGRCGELLVQYRLLAMGIESAPMSTDTGIDLVAYSPVTRLPFTVQVKTNLVAKPGGGKGALALDWWVPLNSPAQYVALVDMSESRIWILTHSELTKAAQQTPASGKLHIFMKMGASRQRKDGKPHEVGQLAQYLLENRVDGILGKAA